MTPSPVSHPVAAALLIAAIALLLWAVPARADGVLPPDTVLELGPPAAEARLWIRGSTDIEAFEPVLRAFGARWPELAIRYEEITTNELYELAATACRGAAPAADLVISSSIDQQLKLANDGCAQSYGSVRTSGLPAWANWRDEVFGLTFEPAVIVYSRALVPPDEVPRSRFDLIDLLRRDDRRYAGRIATYDIEASGVGYLFAFADSQQATTFGRLVEALGRSDAVPTCCSAEIIDGVARGAFLLAYNMLGSYALARAEADPRIGVVAPADYTLILSRAALIPRAAARPDLAKRFLDFVLSEAGRRVLAEASLIVSFGEADDDGPAVVSGGISTLRPIALSPALLVGLDRQKRALFLDAWRSSVGPPAPPLPPR